MAQESTPRLEDASQPHRHDPDQALLEKQIARVRQGFARLIDGYAEGYLDKDELEPRIRTLKERIEGLEAQARQIADQAAWRSELQRVIGRLEEFSTRVRDGLAHLDWPGRRELIRTLVKRVEIDQTHVKVVFRVDAGPFDSGAGEIMQDCRRRDRRSLGNSPSLVPRLRGPPLASAAVHLLHGTFQPLLDQVQHPPIYDPARYRFEQLSVGNAPKRSPTSIPLSTTQLLRR